MYSKNERVKTNEKNTKNSTFEKGEFVGFAINEQKKEIQKDFKEILKNHPEIYAVIQENENLKKENKELLEENIEHGENIEKMKFELKTESGEALKERNNILIQKNNNLKNDMEKLVNEANNVVKQFNLLKDEYRKLKNENKELQEKRGVFKTIQDKAAISLYVSENKELKQKLEKVGRLPITNAQIKQIIELHNNGLGYDVISKRVCVSKSTVCKYVKRYISGKLNI